MCCYIDINNPIYAGLIGSASTWIALSLGKRFWTLIKFRNLSGIYRGQEMDGNPHNDSKEYIVKYNCFQNTIEINQNSKNHGN